MTLNSGLCGCVCVPQGVFLLNTVLTVQAHKANSHRKKGWEKFTDAVINTINKKQKNVVFMLWGKPSQVCLCPYALVPLQHYAMLMPPFPPSLCRRRQRTLIAASISC